MLGKGFGSNGEDARGTAGRGLVAVAVLYLAAVGLSGDMPAARVSLAPGLSVPARTQVQSVGAQGPSSQALGGGAVLHLATPTGTMAVSRAPYTAHAYDSGFGSQEPDIGITHDGVILSYAAAGGTHVIRTRDRGRTFQDVTPMVAGMDAHPQTLDPYLYVDPKTNRVFWSDLVLPCQEIGYSDDAGTTWSQTITNCDENDHQTIFAGPPVTSTPSGYPNIVYDCAISGGVATPASSVALCDKSLDGGVTFANTGSPVFVTDPTKATGNGTVLGTCDGAVGHGFVGPKGLVLVPRGWCGEPWLALSADEGASWTRVQVASNGSPMSLYNVYEHEAGVVQDAAGNIFYMWHAHNRLLYLSVSRDLGKTWSTPLQISAPGVREVSLPAIAIDDRGRLAFVYMGSTNSPGPPFPGEGGTPGDPTCNPLAFLGQSCPDPAQYKDVTWNGYIALMEHPLDATPAVISATVNPVGHPFIEGTCGPIRCKAALDFIDVEFYPDGTPWGVFVDGCKGGCGQGNELIFGALFREPEAVPLLTVPVPQSAALPATSR